MLLSIGEMTNIQVSVQSNGFFMGNLMTNTLIFQTNGLIALTNIDRGLTNLSGAITNLGNQVANTNPIYAASNTIQAWRGLGSPGNATNLAYYPGGSNTTASGSFGAGSNLVSGLSSGYGGVASGIGLGPTTIGSGTNGMRVYFFGEWRSVDPDDVVTPGVLDAVHAFWTIIILCWWLRAVGLTTWEATRAMASAETGGVPDLATEVLGTGGNIVGPLIALLIPVAFIVLWTVVGNTVLNMVGSTSTTLGGLLSSGLPLAGHLGALELANRAFPIALFFSCLTSYLAMPFTVSSIASIAIAASRFLFGK
jgi:hypothetical protein